MHSGSACIMIGFRSDHAFDQRRVVVRKLAKVRLLRRLLAMLLLSDAATLLPRQEFGATVVEFQKLFDQAVKLKITWQKTGYTRRRRGTP